MSNPKHGGDGKPSPTSLQGKLPEIDILVISDVICPWCWISKRRLENAIGSLKDKFNFSVNYSPFLLRPKCPREGIPNPDFNMDNVRALHVREIGEELGLNITFACPKVPYSVPALVLRQFVKENGLPNAVQSEVVDKLHEAYFHKTLPLEREDLLRVAQEVQLDIEAVKLYIDDPANERKVIDQAASWRNHGVQAVPFYYMNGMAVCSGAQETADFVKTIHKVAEKNPNGKMSMDFKPKKKE